MTYLDRRHYQLLIAVRRHGQLSAAATSLGLTQPAASHQVREAERRLGIRLFDRVGRGIRLTEAAERLLEAAIYAEDTLKTAEADAIQLHRGTSPVLRIAVGHYDHVHWLPQVAAALSKEHGGLKLELVRLANHDLQSAVIAGSADLFLSPTSLEFENLPSLPLFGDRLVGVVPISSRASAPLAADFFKKQKYLAFSYHPAHGFEYERYFSPAGVWPKEIVRIESTSAIIELVAAGFGASILPAWCVTQDAASRLVALSDLAPEPIHIMWHVFGRSKLMEGNVSILNTFASAIR
ncbi:LysR family transcriptional regulator [Mesorhizobium escarrei]|uniref:LysR family transcriptional regulator n=1 Tax=Mesorhizobium escarrei TaxID=666018 RepID=A0ABN8JG23_9HYPH|nr:LysR family transcriptional regulator [Mesorhizobium escarrei]CAH2397045.1 putative LysR family transcriptional regulator [Mesorhizobium escarrei]